jgi:hypothetical protein
MDPVAAYVEYLREMARKVAYRGSFLKVLPGTAPKPSRYLDWDSDRPPGNAYLLGVIEDQRTAKEGRSLFIGIGLFIGTLNKNGKARKVTGPFLLVPTETEQGEDDGDGMNLDIHWKSVALNYDLITAIIEGWGQAEDELTGVGFQLPPEITTVVNRVEAMLDAATRQPDTEQRLCDSAFAEELITMLMQGIQVFRRNVIRAGAPYNHVERHRHENAAQLLWFNHRFAFMGNTPSELSAYEALNELCSVLSSRA